MRQEHLGVNSILEGPILHQLLMLFWPILLGTFFQQLYNTADAIIVGQYVGAAGLAAVGGSTGTIISLVVNLRWCWHIGGCGAKLWRAPL